MLISTIYIFFRLDNSESVLIFFLKVVKYTHCPTILTRCGDRIRSNGRSPLTKFHSTVVVLFQQLPASA